MTQNWQVTIGSNKGKARLWIQGKRLAAAGFVAKETLYSVSIEPGRLVIAITREGDHRVSGKGEMPIIDLNTDDLLWLGPIGTKLEIAAQRGKLVLRRAQ